MELNYAKVIVDLAIEEMKILYGVEWVTLFTEYQNTYDTCDLNFIVMP